MSKSKSVNDLFEEYETAKERLDEITRQIDERKSQTIVRCPNKDCLRGYEVRELDYIQTHWYVEPSGCTGGDYWNKGEGRWRCPVCGAVTRLYNKPDISELKPYFKSIVDDYGKE